VLRRISPCDAPCRLRPKTGGSAFGFCTFEAIWVHLRYGPATRSPSLSDGFVNRLQDAQFPSFLLFKLRGLDSYPGGTCTHCSCQPSLDPPFLGTYLWLRRIHPFPRLRGETWGTPSSRLVEMCATHDKLVNFNLPVPVCISFAYLHTLPFRSSLRNNWQYQPARVSVLDTTDTEGHYLSSVVILELDVSWPPIDIGRRTKALY
jgi:hypothetical protein